MEKRFRLRKSGDFQQVRGQGRSWAHPLLVLYARRNDMAQTRVGISVSKRIGNAVTRNRVKRRIREATRLRVERVSQGWDAIFVARVPVAAADFAAVSDAVEQLMRRSGLLSGPPAQARVSRRATGVTRSDSNPPAPGGPKGKEGVA